VEGMAITFHIQEYDPDKGKWVSVQTDLQGKKEADIACAQMPANGTERQIIAVEGD